MLYISLQMSFGATYSCKNYSAQAPACRNCALFFDAVKYLTRAGITSQPIQFSPQDVLFSEGDEADSVFYICAGRVKLAAVSDEGKEATFAMLGPGDFAGDACVVGPQQVRTTTAKPMCECCALRIERSTLLRIIQSEPRFLEFFLGFVMERKTRTEADLLHQLSSSREQRLARLLLVLANISEGEDAEVSIPKVSHELLAEMVGTTRATTTIFMNRFRKQGLIDYDSAKSGNLIVRSALYSILSSSRKCERCCEKTEPSETKTCNGNQQVCSCAHSHPGL